MSARKMALLANTDGDVIARLAPDIAVPQTSIGHMARIAHGLFGETTVEFADWPLNHRGQPAMNEALVKMGERCLSWEPFVIHTRDGVMIAALFDLH